MKRRYKVLGAVSMLVVVALSSLALVLSHNSPCAVAQAQPAGVQSMKAVVHRCYGPPEVLRLEDIARPTLADDRVLIKVHAASVNPLDWHLMRGEPYLIRGMAGLGAPFPTI